MALLMTLGNDIAFKTVYERSASLAAAQCAVYVSRADPVTKSSECLQFMRTPVEPGHV
jgi:hypothetical protein